MHSTLFEWIQKTLYNITRFAYLLVSVAIFDN
jgi:hypothetical protein